MKCSVILLAAMVALPASACTRDDGELGERVDELAERVEQLESQRPSPAARGARNNGRQPSSDEVYAVPVDGSPFEGPEHAQVTIVKAFEYACPYCLRAKKTMDQLREAYGDKIRVVYKSFVVHPNTATVPALAACAAHQQGKFSEMNELIWTKGFSAGRNLGRDNMERLAAELELDMTRFRADLDGKACKEALQNDRTVLTKLGTRGTPNFFVNGHPISGAQPIEVFRKVIDRELEEAEKVLARGGKIQTYYRDNVVKKGKKSI